MRWGEAQERYLASLRAQGRAAGTCAARACSLQAFLKYCQAQEIDLPRELTARHLAAYRRHLTWTPVRGGRLRSLSTVAGYLGAVRSFLRYLVAEGQLLVDPTRDLVLPKVPQALPRLLTVEEVARLLAAPNPRTAHGRRDQTMLELLYGLGLRRRECCQLDLVDYDRSLGLVRVRKPKNRRERFLPVNPQLQRALADYLSHGRPALARFPDEPALFLSARTGRRISAVRLEQMVRNTALAVGLAGVSPHSLRHACATHLLAGGADIRYVQVLLGHEDLASTQTYTHLQPLELLQEHARTHPRARQDSARRAQKTPGCPPDAAPRRF